MYLFVLHETHFVLHRSITNYQSKGIFTRSVFCWVFWVILTKSSYSNCFSFGKWLATEWMIAWLIYFFQCLTHKPESFHIVLLYLKLLIIFILQDYLYSSSFTYFLHKPKYKFVLKTLHCHHLLQLF